MFSSKIYSILCHIPDDKNAILYQISKSINSIENYKNLTKYLITLNFRILSFLFFDKITCESLAVFSSIYEL
jgi:hypothetical protein